MNPSVSLLTVTQYSRVQFLPILKECILSQTYDNIIEWVIVDGCKIQEQSVLLQAALADITNNLPFKVIITPWQNGMPLGALRNTALSLSSGEYLSWLDDDDFYQSGFIAYAVKELMNSSKLIAGCGPMYLYHVSFRMVYQAELISSGNTVNNCMVFKRKYLKTHKYSDDKHTGEEVEFTNSFKEPMIQLDPRRTVVQLCHGSNSYNKTMLLLSAHMGLSIGMRLSTLNISDLVKNKKALKIYDEMGGGSRKRCSYDIVYFCGCFSIKWVPNDTSLGGSEQAVVQLSKEWVKRGKRVAVYGEFKSGDFQETVDGVQYYHYNYFNPYQTFNTLILWRLFGTSPVVTIPSSILQADKILVDVHDNLPEHYERICAGIQRIDKIMFKSKFHVAEYEKISNVRLPWSKVGVVLNGVQLDVFKQPGQPIDRQPFRFCYCSSYSRGLIAIMNLWSHIVKLEPRAELHLYYGIDLNPNDPLFQAYVNALVNVTGVCDHGRKTLDIVAEEKRRSMFHMYPTNTKGEIDCISIRESLVAGCIPILSKVNVFEERDGYFLEGNIDDESNYSQMAADIIALARNKEHCDALRENLSGSSTITAWSDAADSWLKIINAL